MSVCFILYYNYLLIESLTMVRTQPLMLLVGSFLIRVSRLKSIQATALWDQQGEAVTVLKLDAYISRDCLFCLL